MADTKKANFDRVREATLLIQEYIGERKKQKMETTFDIQKALSRIKTDPALLNIVMEMKAAFIAVNQVPEEHQEGLYALIAAHYVTRYADHGE